MNEGSWVVRMECRHEVTFTVAPPMKGERIYCFRCTKMREVVSAPTEYRIRCRACPYGRAFGAARLNAEVAAAKHRKRHATHKVGIYNGRQLIYVMGAKDDAQQGGLWPAGHFPQDPPF